MPIVKVIRKGVTSHIRKVPTSTCAAVLPLTIDQVGREAQTDNEELVRVDDLDDAFAKFKPAISFNGYAGKDENEFRAEYQFRTIKDFDPENLQRRQEVRNESGNVSYLRTT